MLSVQSYFQAVIILKNTDFKCQREKHITDKIKSINRDIHKTSDGIQSRQGRLASISSYFF